MINNKNNIHTLKLNNMINGDYSAVTDDYEENKYNLADIDNPKGWNFDEIDTLGDMGFHICNDTDMEIELDIPSLNLSEQHDDHFVITVFKTDEGYVLKTENRNYVFRTFDDMLEYISKYNK